MRYPRHARTLFKALGKLSLRQLRKDRRNLWIAPLPVPTMQDSFVRLYDAGAMLVLDAERAGGCTGLPPNASRSYDFS